MNKTKQLIALLGTSLLLTACAGDGAGDANISSVESDSVISESLEAESSSVAVESSVESEPAASSEESSEVSSEVSSESIEESTQLNEDEAALIEQAINKISQETGFVEGDGHMFLIDSVQGQVVQINVRETGGEVANNVGLFQYHADTDTLYEQNILTGEFEEYPANE